jgi:hypothetical protein
MSQARNRTLRLSGLCCHFTAAAGPKHARSVELQSSLTGGRTGVDFFYGSQTDKAQSKIVKVRSRATRSAVTSRRKRPARGGESSARRARIHQGVALRSGGQSGDIQGLSNVEDVDSESVSELVEEGQAFEAGIIEGVEDAPDADEGNVKTDEVPEDDVHPEYRDYREKES